VEQEAVYRSIIAAQRAAPERTGADAVAVAARDMAETLDLKAIVAWTSSGATALRVARERPRAPVLALTPNRDTARRLTLAWGVEAVVTKDAHDVDDMANRACKFALRQCLAAQGERILIIAGVPFGAPGATNMLRLAFIGEDGFRAE
jgi:pyruvate kinase